MAVLKSAPTDRRAKELFLETSRLAAQRGVLRPGALLGGMLAANDRLDGPP